MSRESLLTVAWPMRPQSGAPAARFPLDALGETVHEGVIAGTQRARLAGIPHHIVQPAVPRSPVFAPVNDRGCITSAESEMASLPRNLRTSARVAGELPREDGISGFRDRGTRFRGRVIKDPLGRLSEEVGRW